MQCDAITITNFMCRKICEEIEESQKTPKKTEKNGPNSQMFLFFYPSLMWPCWNCKCASSNPEISGNDNFKTATLFSSTEQMFQCTLEQWNWLNVCIKLSYLIVRDEISWDITALLSSIMNWNNMINMRIYVYHIVSIHNLTFSFLNISSS